MKNKKYLFIVGQLGNGGLERQLFYICNKLVSDGHNVSVVCWNYDIKQYYSSKFKSLLNKRLFTLETDQSKISKIIRLRKIVKSDEFTHIISFSAFTNFLTFICALGTKAKVYGSLRTSTTHYLKKQKFKALLNLIFPNKILVNSLSAKKEADSYKLICWWTKFRLLQNVVDIDYISDKANQLIIKNNKFNYNTISIGNIREAKRLDRLIELFEYIKVQYPDLKIKHLHLGGGNIKWMQKLINEKNLSDYITLKGQIENVYPYIKSSDLLLHFSDIEGASNVIMEALALNKPIISTDCGDTSLYVVNDFTGYVIKPFNVKEFSDRLIELSKNENLNNKMSSNSKSEIKKYDIENLMNFFNNAINTTNE